MRIAILYICTGKYNIFWKDFYSSCEKYFIPDAEKQYFVFTDSEYITGENKIHKIIQENLGWPKNTLLRYEFFSRIKKDLGNFDYVFFFNANLLFLEEITPEEFLPQSGKSLVGALHPYFYNKPRTKFPYDTKSLSKAFIDKNEGLHYYQGAINGGKRREFIEAIEHLDQKIKDDIEKDIIALWHDESHWNRYLATKQKEVKTLSPSYLYTEGSYLPFRPKILIRNKDQFGSLNTIRSNKRSLRQIINRSSIMAIAKKIENKMLYHLFVMWDSFYCSEFFVLNQKKIRSPIKETRKISVAITSYNRENIIHKSFKNILNDSRVDEVVILDDGSTEESYESLIRIVDRYNKNKKIKLVRRNINLGLLATKIEAVSLCKNDWVILLDSDNTLMPSYLNSLYKKTWDEKIIYCPSHAQPFFNFKKISGVILNFNNIKEYFVKESRTVGNFLNTCNYFVHKDTYVYTLKEYSDQKVFAADSIFIAYAWLSAGYLLYIVPGMQYIHRVHKKSIWKETQVNSVSVFESIKNKILMSEKINSSNFTKND